MTGLDIEAIRERAQKFEDLGTELSPSNYRIIAIAARSAGDVPVLLAQLERERAALGEALATVREQAAEVKKLREWNDEIKAERDALALAALDHEAVVLRLRAERNDAAAAVADALQVIADLRGGTP